MVAINTNTKKRIPRIFHNKFLGPSECLGPRDANDEERTKKKTTPKCVHTRIPPHHHTTNTINNPPNSFPRPKRLPIALHSAMYI